MVPSAVTIFLLTFPRWRRVPPQGHFVPFFFFLFDFVFPFLDDGFERSSEEFSSLHESEVLGITDDFSVGRILGGGFQFIVVRGGLFEKEFLGGVFVVICLRCHGNSLR